MDKWTSRDWFFYASILTILCGCGLIYYCVTRQSIARKIALDTIEGLDLNESRMIKRKFLKLKCGKVRYLNLSSSEYNEVKELLSKNGVHTEIL